MTAVLHHMDPPSKALLFMEGRAFFELGAFFWTLPLLNRAPQGDGHPVLVLPGMLTSDASTKALREFLKGRGYDVHGWRQGRNVGLTAALQSAMVDQIKTLADAHGRKVSVVGWSLGGLYARQLGKVLPDHVRSVTTLGSPFAGSPRATNAWRVYEFVSGQKADYRDYHFGGDLAETPPMPTTAIYSRTDGVCAWQVCKEQPGALAESIEVPGSHCGMGHNPAVLYALADRLAQEEGNWKPFERTGWRSLVFPDPHR
ncbi:MAG TPA: alpha/beta hydrolase [Beijerinckiaceae bacterium]|nr:alpha/beta hydrolase [Beijerinckiaceae bacterium]